MMDRTGLPHRNRARRSKYKQSYSPTAYAAMVYPRLCETRVLASEQTLYRTVTEHDANMQSYSPVGQIYTRRRLPALVIISSATERASKRAQKALDGHVTSLSRHVTSRHVHLSRTVTGRGLKKEKRTEDVFV
jgi:hypothetical protein